MSAQDSIPEFDVFLCHNSEDKPAVREIAQRLVREGIKPWLDEEQIRPGTSFQKSIGWQIKSIKSAAVFVGEKGFGPWQDQETQALLSQLVNRECPVIPAILPSAKTTPELPWTLENRHWVDFRVPEPDPLKQLIWGITGKKPTATESLVPEKKELSEPRGRYSESRLYPPLAELPDQENRTQLDILRRRVMEYWVDGVLRHSVYKEVLISLGKRPVDSYVDAPWKYTVELSEAVHSEPLNERSVSTIYDATGLLLILGEPGSGKTTALLDLARTLLERARENIRERVAVVLNLSSWKKQPLVEWMSGELSEKYRVPRKIARLWLQQNYLIPLLDGLDEVETSIQSDCAAAINRFIEESNPSGLVVCCRLNEYRWLPERLKLNGAIRLEPLSEGEVDEYFATGGPELNVLREAVHTDPVLGELAHTPLMLSVMSLASQGLRTNELAGHNHNGESPEERRKQIFSLYVEQMFRRKGTASLVFSKEKIIGWLSWLAGRMREHSESVFLVEGLQPSWLGTRVNRLAYRTIVALTLGLIFGCVTVGLTLGVKWDSDLDRLIGALFFGLIMGLSILVGIGLGCWSESPLKRGIISGLTAGLIVGLSFLIFGLTAGRDTGLTVWASGALLFGLIGGTIGGLIGGFGGGSLIRITLVETLSWKWNQFWKRTIPGLISGLIVGLIGALILLLVSELISFRAVTVEPINALLRFLLFSGLIFGLIFGLISGLIGGFTDTVKVGKASPNQGIKLSRKNSWVVFLVTWAACGLIGVPIGGLISWLGFFPGQRLFFWLIAGLISGLILGLIGGLDRGGSAVIKHYALRLILWLKGYTPLKFIKFLDQCAKLIFLKKVGGGYIFIHRMLLEYFADLGPRSTRS